MRPPHFILALVLPTVLACCGCATRLSDAPPSDASLASSSKYEEGPKKRPDDRKWRRKPVPIPPFYAKYTSGSGNEWTVITPLYWQVDGHDRSRKTLFPIMTAGEDRVTERKSGYFLNRLWKDTPRGGHRILLPIFWDFESESAETSVYGPLYVRKEHHGDKRKRVLFFPRLYSRETDESGYDYRGVLFRFIGYEKQVFERKQEERLRLFFVFPSDMT